MRRNLKRMWCDEEVHHKLKSKAAAKGMSIKDYLARLAEESKDSEKSLRGKYDFKF